MIDIKSRRIQDSLVCSLLGVSKIKGGRVFVLAEWRRGRIRGTVSIPVIGRVFVPVVDLLLQRPGLSWAINHPCLVVLAELHVCIVLTGHRVVILELSSPLEHAPVVPRAETQPGQTAHNVGHDVVHVEIAVVGKETLNEFGAHAQRKGADDKRHVEGSPAIGIDDPVEDDGEEEECDRMQDFIVDIVAELERRETGIASEQE